MASDIELTQDLLHEFFDYKDGHLYWKIRKPGVRFGKPAGFLDSGGYINMGINNKTYLAHRIIYLYHHGYIDDTLEIDHINGIRNDNHIENLRLVTRQENRFNLNQVKGYYWNKNIKKWHAQICVNKHLRHLGYCDSEIEARDKYLKAKKMLHIIKEH